MARAESFLRVVPTRLPTFAQGSVPLAAGNGQGKHTTVRSQADGLWVKGGTDQEGVKGRAIDRWAFLEKLTVAPRFNQPQECEPLYSRTKE